MGQKKPGGMYRGLVVKLPDLTKQTAMMGRGKPESGSNGRQNHRMVHGRKGLLPVVAALNHLQNLPAPLPLLTHNPAVLQKKI